MQIVIELDAARISRAFSQCRKLGVIVTEAVNRAHNMQIATAGIQARMALRTNRICCGGQPKSAFVFHMAGTASRRERLTRVVYWRVVAGKAGFIGDVLKISRLVQVA
jgi:hypothetical protein